MTTKTQKYRAKWKNTIVQFLEDHSRVMPNKKDTIEINGERVAKRHLLTSKEKKPKALSRLWYPMCVINGISFVART